MKVRSRISGFVAAATIAFLMASPAAAHPGHGEAGIVDGLLHPLGGFDHLVAMAAIGLLAAKRSAGSVWTLPLCFVSMMAAGMMMGSNILLAGAGTEFGLAACVILTGFALLPGTALNQPLTVLLASASGLFNGMAHASDQGGFAVPLAFAVGALATTALLHLAGSLGGRSLLRLSPEGRGRIWRWLGMGTAASGALAMLA